VVFETYQKNWKKCKKNVNGKSFRPGPFSSFAPGSEPGVATLKGLMDDGTIAPEKTMAMVLDTYNTAKVARNVIKQGLAAHVGWFFVTEKGPNTAYQGLPSTTVWNAIVKALKAAPAM
jgi:hypothetical protein